MKEWLRRNEQHIVRGVVFIVMGLGMYVVATDIFNNFILAINSTPLDLSNVGAPISAYGLFRICVILGVVSTIIVVISAYFPKDGPDV